MFHFITNHNTIDQTSLTTLINYNLPIDSQLTDKNNKAILAYLDLPALFSSAINFKKCLMTYEYPSSTGRLLLANASVS